MSLSFIHPFIYIDETEEKGRGVFCRENLEPDTLIEISPVIPLSKADRIKIHETALHDYYFSWGEDQLSGAIALGYISVYNHSEQPNCIYEADFDNNTIKLITQKNIKAGEELTINYNLDGNNENKLWFEVK